MSVGGGSVLSVELVDLSLGSGELFLSEVEFSNGTVRFLMLRYERHEIIVSLGHEFAVIDLAFDSSESHTKFLEHLCICEFF